MQTIILNLLIFLFPFHNSTFVLTHKLLYYMFSESSHLIDFFRKFSCSVHIYYSKTNVLQIYILMKTTANRIHVTNFSYCKMMLGCHMTLTYMFCICT